jgi:hypothetical protein
VLGLKLSVDLHNVPAVQSRYVCANNSAMSTLIGKREIVVWEEFGEMMSGVGVSRLPCLLGTNAPSRPRHRNRKDRSANLPWLQRGRSEVSELRRRHVRWPRWRDSTYTHTAMSAPLRPTILPQCSACVRNYAFGVLSGVGIGAAGLGQQVRGKKKLAKNTSSAVPVRLLKNVKTFGKKGETFRTQNRLYGH